VAQFERHGVRFVTQKNLGAAAARNTALALSRGQYIQWLDADDLLAPDKIAKQVEALKEHPSTRTLLCSAFGRFSYRHRRAKFTPTALWCDLSPLEWLSRKMADNAYMQTATWLVSRELAEAAGPWDTRLLGDDDGEYFCRVLLASDWVRFVPGARVYYRTPFPNTLSDLGHCERKLRAHWLSMQLHIKYLRSMEDNEQTRAACLNFIQTSLIYFYPEWPDLLEEMNETAEALGGQLSPPRLSWKYSWVLGILGWNCAKRLQIVAPKMRWMVQRWWEKAIFRFEARKMAASGPAVPAISEGWQREP
jgi:glycosyltransferase involved in cell wall biosynthesis